MGKFVRIVLLLLNVVCAILLLLSTLTEWLAPSQMRLPSLFCYAYPYLLVVNVLWIIGWLCFARKEFLLSTLVVVLRIGFVPQFVQLSGTDEVAVSDTTLRVMTFNVHGFFGPDDTLSPKVGAERCVELLHKEQPDVVSFEEFFPPNGYDLLDTLQSLGYQYNHSLRKHLSGVALFSKYPLQPVALTEHEGLMCTDVLWPHQTVRLVSVHLDSYQLTDNETQAVSHFHYDSSNVRSIFHKMLQTTRQHEQQWQDGLLPIITASSSPVVVAGDYNDIPSSYIYLQISKYLTDAFVKQGKGMCTTYNGKMMSYRIDHIFCSPELDVVAYKCIDSDISDHYPVMATFQLKGTK